MSSFISVKRKSVEKSNNDSLGNGGLLVTISDTTTVTWSAATHVKPFKYIEISDITGFTQLGFTPSEGLKKDTEVEVSSMFPTSALTTRIIGSVLRIPDGAGGYEVVEGSFTTIQLSTGEAYVYGES